MLVEKLDDVYILQRQINLFHRIVPVPNRVLVKSLKQSGSQVGQFLREVVIILSDEGNMRLPEAIDRDGRNFF